MQPVYAGQETVRSTQHSVLDVGMRVQQMIRLMYAGLDAMFILLDGLETTVTKMTN